MNPIIAAISASERSAIGGLPYLVPDAEPDRNDERLVRMQTRTVELMHERRPGRGPLEEGFGSMAAGAGVRKQQATTQPADVLFSGIEQHRFGVREHGEQDGSDNERRQRAHRGEEPARPNQTRHRSHPHGSVPRPTAQTSNSDRDL